MASLRVAVSGLVPSQGKALGGTPGTTSWLALPQAWQRVSFPWSSPGIGGTGWRVVRAVHQRLAGGNQSLIIASGGVAGSVLGLKPREVRCSSFGADLRAVRRLARSRYAGCPSGQSPVGGEDL